MKHLLSSLAIVLAAAALHASQTPPASPLGVVRIAGGRIEGIVSGPGIAAFKGVPFAAPPVGDLRWRAPQPAARWDGVRKADTFGANCMQNIVNVRKPWTYECMAHGDVSEDCLFLNVWTPARTAADRRPVLIFIHGGGNTEGSGSVLGALGWSSSGRS